MACPVVVEFHSVPFLKASAFLLSVASSLRLSFAHLLVSGVPSCHCVSDLVLKQTQGSQTLEQVQASSWLVGSAPLALTVTNPLSWFTVALWFTVRNKSCLRPTKLHILNMASASCTLVSASAVSQRSPCCASRRPAQAAPLPRGLGSFKQTVGANR